MTADTALLAEDLATYAGVEGATVTNIAGMSNAQIANIINNTTGSVIGGFCNSGACLLPLLGAP